MDEIVKLDMERRLESMRLIHEWLYNEDNNADLILKAHLIVEYLMDGFLRTHLGDKAAPIFDLDLTFYKKLSLVSGYKLLPENIVVALKRLNQLRNKCAHTLSLKVTREDALALFESIKDGMPYSNYDGDLRFLLLRYLGWIAGYLTPKTWE